MNNVNVIPSFYLIRGLPGSGKSTLAKKIQSTFNPSAAWYEADQYFTDKDGNYNWESSRLCDAHEWCEDSVLRALQQGRHTIVSNVFARYLGIVTYFWALRGENIIVNPIIIDCVGDFGSIHGVPEDVLKGMRERYESQEVIKDKLINDGFTNVVFHKADHYVL